MRVRRSILLSASAVTASTLVLTGCAAAGGGSTQSAAAPAVAPIAAPFDASVADTKCKDGQNQVASLDPKLNNITTDPNSVKSSKTLDNIKKNHHLTVGTSGDVLLWGATNPKTGVLEGYDIDLLAQIATYAGVKPEDTVYKVINYGERLTALKSHAVDVVAHTMTINCDRWQGTGTAPNAINFSSEYYRAGQKVLVRADSTAKTIDDLKGQPICVPSASTNLALIQKLGFKDIVALDVVGDCLVKFQEGEVSAITGDDTVLAGFAAQDPYAVLLSNKPLSEEPYGVGINADDPQFTEFVNAVIEKLRTNGKLTSFYNTTMRTALPDAPTPTPPPAVYGRDISKLQRPS
jgi:polar amino acid transport system substrate-binding protein